MRRQQTGYQCGQNRSHYGGRFPCDAAARYLVGFAGESGNPACKPHLSKAVDAVLERAGSYSITVIPLAYEEKT